MLIMIIKLGSLHITTTAHRLLEQELTKLSKLIQLRLKYYCRILFLKFQPHLLSSSIITPSKCWQLFFTCCNASASDSCDQNLAQYVALKSTCKYELGLFRWNTTSFRLNQMAQHIAVAPIIIHFLLLRLKPISQGPSMLVILLGGAIPKVTTTTFQINFAT